MVLERTDANGERVWIRDWTSSDESYVNATGTDVAVSPDGTLVYVAGEVFDEAGENGALPLVAVRRLTGLRRRITGTHRDDRAVSSTEGSGWTKPERPRRRPAMRVRAPILIIGIVAGLIAALLVGPSSGAGARPRCTITGTGRSDELAGTAGPDVICGRGGSDWIVGLGGADVLYGGRGADDVSGRGGDDRIFGGGGPDDIQGGSGDDRLFGQRGRDTIEEWSSHGPGEELLSGGPGGDQLSALDGIDDDRLFGGLGDDNACSDPGDVTQGFESHGCC
jgi:hypothetical protein